MIIGSSRSVIRFQKKSKSPAISLKWRNRLIGLLTTGLITGRRCHHLPTWVWVGNEFAQDGWMFELRKFWNEVRSQHKHKDGLDSVRISSKWRASSCQAVLQRGLWLSCVAFCDSKFVCVFSLSSFSFVVVVLVVVVATHKRKKNLSVASPTASSHGEIIVDIRGKIGAYVYVCIAYARLACLLACLLAEGTGSGAQRKERKGWVNECILLSRPASCRCSVALCVLCIVLLRKRKLGGAWVCGDLGSLSFFFSPPPFFPLLSPHCSLGREMVHWWGHNEGHASRLPALRWSRQSPRRRGGSHSTRTTTCRATRLPRTSTSPRLWMTNT